MLTGDRNVRVGGLGECRSAVCVSHRGLLLLCSLCGLIQLLLQGCLEGFHLLPVHAVQLECTRLYSIQYTVYSTLQDIMHCAACVR